MTEFSLCKEPDGVTPCRFVGQCAETRQRLQHYADLRGNDCWAYQQKTDRIAVAHRAPPVAGGPDPVKVADR